MVASNFRGMIRPHLTASRNHRAYSFSRLGLLLEYVIFELFLIQTTESPPQLLASPTFHRMVRNVHKKVREIRHGPDIEEMGGTKIDG